MITGAIENIAQTNNACVYISWQAPPIAQKVVQFVVSYYQDTDPTHVYQVSSTNLNAKIGGLYQGQLYWFTVQSLNTLGELSPLQPFQSFLTPTDTIAPATPISLLASGTLRGAQVSLQPNTEPDLQGYLFQVSIGQAPYQTINAAPQLGTTLNYQAPPGTPVGTILAFRVAAQDWSGNVSPWSVGDGSSETALTTGVPFDEVVSGNLTVVGKIGAGGGFQTAPSGQRVTVDETGVTLYDASQNDYGAGVGVTVKLNALTGGGFFSGQLVAGTVLTGGIQSGSSQNVPTVPPNFTGFQLDALYGMRFFKNGSMTAQFAATGEIDIYSGANLNAVGGTITGATLVGSVLSGPAGVLPSAVFDLTGTPSIVFTDNNNVERLRLGEYVSSVDGTTQYGLQGKDATGTVRLDTQPQHAWTMAVDQTANRGYTQTPLSGTQVLPASSLVLVSAASFTASGVVLVHVSGTVWVVVAYSGKSGNTLLDCTTTASVSCPSGNGVIQAYPNGSDRRLITVSADCATTATADTAYIQGITTLGGAALSAASAGITVGAANLAGRYSIQFQCDPLGYYAVDRRQASAGSVSTFSWLEVDF